MTSIMYSVILASLAVFCQGFPGGVPVNRQGATVCSDMTPQHGADPMDNKKSPYRIVVSQKCYKDGVPVEVRIEGDVDMEGVFVQARPSDNINSVSVGTFEETESHLMPVNCNNKRNNALSHDKPIKERQVRFTWRPEQGYQQPIKFFATVVQAKVEFWKMIPSQKIEFKSNCEAKSLPAGANGIKANMGVITLFVGLFVLGSAFFF